MSGEVNKAESKAKRGSIKQPSTLQLWVRAGGRCSLCNRYLLEEEFFERPINVGERAHVAGATDAPNSPRGDSKVPLDQRDKADNLILLCPICHKIIDDKGTRDDYPEQRVLTIKAEHEERIFHLTGLGPDRESTVLRLIGKIRGATPELARKTAIEAVFRETARYARFKLAPDRISVEIDLTRLHEPDLDESTYWKAAQMQIDGEASLIARGIQRGDITHLSVFALARIPLLVYLGFILDDKTPLEIFQKQRGGEELWGWPENGPGVEFEQIELRNGTSDLGTVLLLSLSGTLDLDDVPPELDDASVHIIKPIGETPSPNLFRSRATLTQFESAYRNYLARLESDRKSIETIHVLPAIPTSAAIVVGRSIMRHVHPTLLVYDRVGQTFNPALSVNAE